MNENTVFVTSDSMFRIDPGTQSRQLGPAHPWDFNYVNPSSHTLPPTCPPSTSTLESDSQLRNPYWKRACVEPKALSIPSGPFLTSTQIKFQSPSSTNQFSSDPNLIPLLQRLGSHPQYHQLIVDYKRHSLPSHVGLISNKYFLTSLQSIKFPLKKSEFNLLLKEFRAIGFPDTFNYQRMIDMINQL